MCISADTSFGLAAILVPVGGYCLTTAGQRDRSTLPLAAVPLLFGIQQSCDGVVWVGIGRENAELTQSAALAYLFFALTFWLFWIPLSAVCLESRRTFRFVRGISALLGLAGGSPFYLPILRNPDALVVSVDHHSIRYDFARSAALQVIPQLAWQLAYLVTISLPLLVVAQHRKGLIVLSTSLVVSAAISHTYFWYAYTSVRCLFAAILSLIITYECHRLPLALSGSLEAPPIEPIPKPTV